MARWLVILKVHNVRLVPAPAVAYQGNAHCASLDEAARPQLKHMLQSQHQLLTLILWQQLSDGSHIIRGASHLL